MSVKVALGEVCQFVGGGTPSRKMSRYWNGNIPWATVKDFRSQLISCTEESISQEGLDNSASRIIPAGAVLLVTRIALGKVAMAGVDLAINQDIKAIVPLNNHVSPEFLFWSLKHLGPQIACKGTGATVKGVTLKDVKELSISLPPLDEQRRIAGILNRAAKIERLQTQAQERLREFVPALFVRMFGDPAPATNPMGWDTAHLGDVCTIVGGGTPRRSNAAYFGGPIPWAKPTDVTALTNLFICATRETITEAALRESSARLVPASTVLLTSRATIGYTAVAATPMATNQGFINLTCSDRLLPEYLANWFPLRRDYLVQLAGGTTFKEISKSALKQIRVPLPPLNEQRRFAGIAATAQTTVERMELAARIAATLNASLMSRLLEDAA